LLICYKMVYTLYQGNIIRNESSIGSRFKPTLNQFKPMTNLKKRYKKYANFLIFSSSCVLFNPLSIKTSRNYQDISKLPGYLEITRISRNYQDISKLPGYLEITRISRNFTHTQDQISNDVERHCLCNKHFGTIGNLN